jgi:ElaB/YqjD/DUF883 family membrane-anchored ribosome-binding protein
VHREFLRGIRVALQDDVSTASRRDLNVEGNMADTRDIGEFADEAANVKDRVVDAVTEISDAASDNARRLARQTVEGVQRGADYFRNNGIQQIAEDLRDYAKANPTQALVGAAFVGFCLGRLMSREMRR